MKLLALAVVLALVGCADRDRCHVTPNDTVECR